MELNLSNMSTITVTASLLLGNDDASVNIFNHVVTYEHYFSATSPNPWKQDLAPGDYLVGVAGNCAPGGSVQINITKISGSTPAMPLPKITAAGPYLQSATITV